MSERNARTDGQTAHLKDPRFGAAVVLIGHTGAEQFGLRYQDDDQPVIWIAHAAYKGGTIHKVAADLSPIGAVLNLCEDLLDGGTCTHCGRITGFNPTDEEQAALAVVRYGGEEGRIEVCWYQYDPDRAVYHRSCEQPT